MAGAKEKVQLEVAGSYGTDGKIDKEKLEKNLQNLKGNVAEKEGYLYEVTVDGETFDILETGEVRETNTPQEPPFENTIQPGEKVTEEQGNTEYRNNGRAIIPVGFCIVPGCEDVSEGLVISDNDGDTEVDEDNIKANGNQFVWIPVTNPDNYKINKNFALIGFSSVAKCDTGYLPEGIELEEIEGKTEEELTEQKEKELVTNKEIQGFYVSRYEAGDNEATENRKVGETIERNLVSKKDKFPFIQISQEDSKKKAKEFINNKYVKSALASGIQWDMVMAFIGTGRKDGNGEDYIVTEVSRTRHIGTDVDKTGKNEADRVCNIYDLEGNVFEYVAQKYSSDDTWRGVRGGRWYLDETYIDRNTASTHNVMGNEGTAGGSTAFRFVLYVM